MVGPMNMFQTRLRLPSGSSDQPLIRSLVRFQATRSRRRPVRCADTGPTTREHAAVVGTAKPQPLRLLAARVRRDERGGHVLPVQAGERVRLPSEPGAKLEYL